MPEARRSRWRPPVLLVAPTADMTIALRICLGLPGRPCTERTRNRNGRCGPCESAFQRNRNRIRVQYHGSWKSTSRAARRNQPWCSNCGTLVDLTFDHERGVVECRSCNSSHRRNPA